MPPRSLLVLLALANVALWIARAATRAFDKSALRGRRARALVVLGSGGHTAEMLRILRDARTLDRLDVAAYVVASTDAQSADRALAFERSRRGARGEARVLTIGRAREVGQRWTTSAATTARACAAALAIVARVNPDVVICNGPGTCVPIVLAAMARRALGWRTPATVFVESACRARTLSLTGKIFYHLRCVDRVCVMWERAHAAYPRSTFVGRAM